MSVATQPLRDEHQELLPQIDALQTVADAVGHVPAHETASRLDDTLAFLSNHLLIHAQAEEEVLYPAVAKAMGAPEATATMLCDHAAIRQMTTDLRTVREHLGTDRLSDVDVRALHRLLYGLHTLVRVHLAKEEEVFLPLLDATLTDAEARVLYATMEQAAHAQFVERGLR